MVRKYTTKSVRTVGSSTGGVPEMVWSFHNWLEVRDESGDKYDLEVTPNAFQAIKPGVRLPLSSGQR